ncbi:MAG: hypothetical protein K6L75_06625 [Cellvibrionaceae bacterium]
MSPSQDRKNKESAREHDENIHRSSINSRKNFESFFINRRSNSRRSELDPCKEMPVDLYNRKRRKSTDRRNKNKTLADDFYSFTEK